MNTTGMDQRFFASTRGQIVTLLRRTAPCTVEELANALNLTDNAVRAHLAALERDGLVKQAEARRGTGKPSFTYELTPGAENLFPKPYGPVLRSLLDLLAEEKDSAELEELLREVGKRIASGLPASSSSGSKRARLEAAVAMLNEIGGLTELEETHDSYVIQGYSCPLALLVPAHAEACHLAESLVAEFTGLPVKECCQHNGQANCRFQVEK
jgi:predicted ArsR family transcriptional regulator